MRNSKKLFVVVAVVFILILLYIIYDMGRRTTAPWQKNKDATEIAE